MLTNVARQLEQWRPPRARVVISLCLNISNNASPRFYSASNGTAFQSLLKEHHIATESPQFTCLPNDCKSEQNISHRPRNRIQTAHRSSSTRNSSKKLMEHMAASHLLQKVLGKAEDVEYWKRRIAKFRTIRLPIVLLQEIMRQEESESDDSSELMPLLPTEDEIATMLKQPALAIHNREAVDYFVYVLRGHDDKERCQRYLEKSFFTPQFIFNFLVRPSADFVDTGTLLAMIDSSQSYFDVAEKAKMMANLEAKIKPRDNFRVPQGMLGRNLNIDQANFDLIMRLLVAQCLRLEPRFVVLLAHKASEYIQRMASGTDETRKLYLNQCNSFNGCLEIFRPQPRLQTVQQSMPNAYFLEAHRILLSMSAGLARPLLISRTGFRAIRDVLSGQPKNDTEVHSSTRHAPGWPPYLQPGHGMDELSDAEDNWSRTVCAGMLMQEAGFSKDELDAAVDILQGMDMDGAPTIQQRSAIGKGRNIGVWEASIRATRNAQEAWERFKNPPGAELEPGLDQYAAMLEKLVMREVEPESRFLPGDKALNFPTQHEANLTEFERARLRPPSVSELYYDMKLAGVAPEGACLRLLVANAESLETAHQYLRDSPAKGKAFENLMTNEPDPRLLMTVPLGLFAAYIQVCLRVEGRKGNSQLMRAIRLSEVRLKGVRSRWMPFVWGIILKDLSQHHRALSISLKDQLGLISRVADAIETRAGLQLSSFTQFNNCVRKVIRREVNKLFASGFADENEVQRGFIPALNCQTLSSVQGIKNRKQHDAVASEASLDDSTKPATTTAMLQKVSSRTKTMFWALAEREREVQMHLDPYQIAPLERLRSRRDAVRSEDAYEYMLTLGYLGQFDEMARLLDWLIQEWGHSDVVSALSELDELPLCADLFETLCVFRLMAEPMLRNCVVEMLLQKIADSRLKWTWPDDEAVKNYADLHNDETIRTLCRIVKWARDGNQATQHLA